MMAAPASPRPAPSLGDLAATMLRLTDILDRESALLRGGGGPELGKVQEEKARLTQAYAQAIAAVRGSRTPLADEMKAGAQRLATAVERNAKILRAMTEAADRIVAAMVGAIKEQRGGSIGYARPRAFQGHTRVAAGVTLDQRL